MTTYICKCGKTFGKNTGAGTTGFRMPGYGPEHECYGCPFIQKERWRENNRDVDAYACRGSKALDYQTDAYCCDSKGAALHVRTLDLEFIQAFFKDYLTLPGHTYEHLYHGMDSPENGRWPYSFGFSANKQGAADRETLIARYFRSEGERPGVLPSGADRLVRKDVTADEEKEIVLNQIKEAKALAQGVKSPESVPTTKYTDGRFIYFIAPGEAGDGKFITWYRDSTDLLSDPKAFRVVASGATFDDAQAALDTYARQNGNLKPCSGPDETAEAEQLSIEDVQAEDPGGAVDEMPDGGMPKMIIPFVRSNGHNLWINAVAQELLNNPNRVDIEINTENNQIIIRKNDEAGMFKVTHTHDKQCKISTVLLGKSIPLKDRTRFAVQGRNGIIQFSF